MLMGVFGIGAALPVVALAYVSCAAAMIISGANKLIETWLVDHSPAWLTKLTTRF